MLPQNMQHTMAQFFWRLLALLRTALIHVLGGQHHDHNARPICNGVAEKRADMAFLVADRVKHDPEQENAARDNGETVPLKECLVLLLPQRELQSSPQFRPGN